MSAKLKFEAGLRHQEANARLQALQAQAKQVESRYEEYVKALQRIPSQGLYSISSCCFIKLGKQDATTVLNEEKKRLFKDVEDVQREIVKLEREILVIEIEAGLSVDMEDG